MAMVAFFEFMSEYFWVVWLVGVASILLGWALFWRDEKYWKADGDPFDGIRSMADEEDSNTAMNIILSGNPAITRLTNVEEDIAP